MQEPYMRPRRKRNGRFIVTLISVLIVFGIFRRVFWGNCVDIIMDIVRISPEYSLVHQTAQVVFCKGLILSYVYCQVILGRMLAI